MAYRGARPVRTVTALLAMLAGIGACGARSDLEGYAPPVAIDSGARDVALVDVAPPHDRTVPEAHGDAIAVRDAADVGRMDAPKPDAGHDAQHDGGHDAGHDGGIADAAPDIACTSVCTTGDTVCRGGALSTCVAGEDGCEEWGAPVACPANQSCVVEGIPAVAACVCNARYTLVAGACAPVVASILAPRAIAPLSTATVTSQLPLLRWALGSGNDGAVVDICLDRACAAPVVSFAGPGTSGTPPASLAKGLYYWRLRGTANGSVGSLTSPVWEFFVGARSTTVNTSWGTTLDVNGDGLADVIAGAPFADASGGAVYLYLGATGGLSTVPATTLTPPPSGPDLVFGKSVASAGDVNGDGFADVIVGAPSMNIRTPPAACVFLGGAAGLSTTPIVLYGPNSMGLGFGQAVASAGDVNGDGFADVIVAEPGGGAYVFLGSSGGPSTTPVALTQPGGAESYGQSVACAGDVNGDGFADVLVGAPSQYGGAAYLYLGGPAGLSQTPTALTAPSSPFVNYVGYTVASAGDVDGDGYADVLVTAPDLFNYGIGPALLYLGGSGGTSMTPTVLTSSSGWSATGVGDVNGDGFADVAISVVAPGAGAWVLLGGPGGASMTPLPLDGLDGAAGYVTYAILAAAGDVNGDGFADVVAGSSAGGEFGLFLGVAGGISTSPATTLVGPGDSGFGGSIARGGIESGRTRAGAAMSARTSPAPAGSG